MVEFGLYHRKTFTISCKSFYTWLFACCCLRVHGDVFEDGSRVKKLLFFLHGQTNTNLVTWVILQLSSVTLLPSWKINIFFLFLNASFCVFLWRSSQKPLCKTSNGFFLFTKSNANSFGPYVLTSEIWTLSPNLRSIAASHESYRAR